MAVDHLANLLQHVESRQHAVGQVRPVEVADEFLRRSQAELLDDVAADALGGGRGVAVNGGAREELAQTGELPVLGSEVVSPVADAVSLVDGDGVRAPVSKELMNVGVDEPLRRGEDESRSTPLDGFECGRALAHRLPAIEPHRRDADARQAVDLVLHERDERRHNHRDTVSNDSRGLVTERLAAAGWQDDEGIAAIEDGADRLFLLWAERRESPVPLDGGEKFVGQHGSGSHGVNPRSEGITS